MDFEAQRREPLISGIGAQVSKSFDEIFKKKTIFFSVFSSNLRYLGFSVLFF